MNGDGAVLLALVLAALIVAALSKLGKTLVGGIFQRDSKGRMVLVLTPTPKPRKRERSRK